MRAKDHDKNTLDAIGRRLIESDAVRSDDIESILADPYLFARISARMKDQPAAVPMRSPIFVRYAAAAAGMAVIVFAAITAIVSLRSATEVSHVIEVQAPADVPAMARPANLPPLRAGSNPTSGRAIYRDTAVERSPVRAVSTRTEPRHGLTVPGEDAPEFYPIGDAGDPRETAGGHIVRVEMPRSSLFALGVNVPLENDSETVKADLLVGADGVTRAIRVVK